MGWEVRKRQAALWQSENLITAEGAIVGGSDLDPLAGSVQLKEGKWVAGRVPSWTVSCASSLPCPSEELKCTLPQCKMEENQYPHARFEMSTLKCVTHFSHLIWSFSAQRFIDVNKSGVKGKVYYSSSYKVLRTIFFLHSVILPLTKSSIYWVCSAWQPWF